MSKLSFSAIGALPEYRELLKKRRIIAWPLSLIMLAAYYSFILLVAYEKELLATPVGDGVLTVGIVFGLGIILLTLLVTVIYVWYANTKLDDLVKRIQEKAQSHE